MKLKCQIDNISNTKLHTLIQQLIGKTPTKTISNLKNNHECDGLVVQYEISDKETLSICQKALEQVQSLTKKPLSIKPVEHKQSQKVVQDTEILYPNNPDISPEIYTNGIKGTKINQEDGSIWSRDKSSHGDRQWKRWPSLRDYNNNTNKQSVWEDGRLRKTQ